jgi:hypothetical protein
MADLGTVGVRTTPVLTGTYFAPVSLAGMFPAAPTPYPECVTSFDNQSKPSLETYPGVRLQLAFKSYLASNHTSPATGRTIAMVLSKNCGAFANPSGGATNATEMSLGWYYVDLTTTDTGTLGPLIVRGTQAQIDPVELL